MLRIFRLHSNFRQEYDWSLNFTSWLRSWGPFYGMIIRLSSLRTHRVSVEVIGNHSITPIYDIPPIRNPRTVLWIWRNMITKSQYYVLVTFVRTLLGTITSLSSLSVLTYPPGKCWGGREALYHTDIPPIRNSQTVPVTLKEYDWPN